MGLHVYGFALLLAHYIYLVSLPVPLLSLYLSLCVCVFVFVFSAQCRPEPLTLLAASFIWTDILWLAKLHCAHITVLHPFVQHPLDDYCMLCWIIDRSISIASLFLPRARARVPRARATSAYVH
jgi:RsiW-degrading membrane proteinase PrsW (M82 family)